MSVDKFRFVSPGVFTNEIDNSRLPRAPDAIGPAIIGRSQRGPILRPVRVESFSDFTDIFGEPVAGGVGGDVWRDGNRTAPTYAAYAAQAYLKNSGGLTFVRLGGYENDNAETAGAAGWKTNNAYGLFVMPISGSGDIFTTDGAADAVLSAIVYADASGTDFGLVGKELSGSAQSTSSQNKWIRATGNQLEFKIVVGGEEKVINFDKNSKKYIRSVLNTNPILTNDSITTSPEEYFLGETFGTFVEEKIGSIAGSNFAACLVKLASGSCDFGNFKEEAQNAESGWVVSQHKGATGSFAAVDGEYPVQKLFRFVGLSEGEWNSQNLKISIEDIKEPPNQYVKFGSFTVSIRKMSDNDMTPQYIERYTNLSLDPSSENYIAKKIGDKYANWDYEKKEFIEYGLYNNNSKFVRVEMDSDVDAGLTDKDLIPFGFYAPTVISDSVAVRSGSSVTVDFISSAVTGNQIFSASFMLPEIPMLETTADSVASSFTSMFFGLKTNVEKTKKTNADLVDLVRIKPVGYSGENSFLFSLDDLSGSFSGSTFQRSQPVVWAEGKRAAGQSFTALGSSSVLLANFNRFTLPLVGGSDGVDITEKDPFNKRVLGVGDEYTNYAYNSVKVAVEAIADAEIVEMNLAAMPGIENEGLTGLLMDKCEVRGDALAIIDLKGDYDPTAPTVKPSVTDVINNLSDRGINSSYGCAFFPWVLIRDTINNNTVWVPPSVAALGTFSSSQKKTELWFAPAGFNRGGLTDGAAGLPVIQTALRLNSKNRDDLYAANINPIATFPAEGIVIFGQKTLQVTPSALDRINVRRLMIYLKKEVSSMAKVVLFDPNVEVTWKRFTNLAVPFLESVQARFGLSDFRVVLDSTTTTPELVDRNIVYAKILLKPTRAIEFIALDFVLAPTGASFND